MYDNTVSARTYLSYIAEQAGGIAVIGRDGKLYIKTIGESSVTLPLKLFKTFKWGEKFKITRVRYDDGIQLFEKGDTTGNTVYISQDNMYIVDQDQINNIYNTLKGLEFYSFEGECIIDPALDTGDIVVIDGKNVIYQGSMQFSGRWIANIESKIQCKAKEETTTRTPSQRTINRRVESNINQIDGKITQLTEETTENTQKITKVEQDVSGITSKVSSVEQSVENITNTQNTATGKNIHLEDSSDEPLASIKPKGETNQSTRSGKNLLLNNLSTITRNGVTATINDDKTVNVNGTNSSTSIVKFRINNDLTLPAGTYKLSGCPNGGTKTTYRLAVQDSSWNVLAIDIGTGVTFTLSSETTVKVNIYIQGSYSANNLLFKPMISLDGGEYEQYGVSPSPDFLSPIQNVEGDIEVKVTGKNSFDLSKIRNTSSAFTVTETGVNLTNCFATNIYTEETAEDVSKTFKPNTTYTMKAKAKVVSRPSTITADNNALFALYRPATNPLGYVFTKMLDIPDKKTINLNTEKEYISTFKTPADMTDVGFLSYTFHGNNNGSNTGVATGEIDVSEIMLVEGTYTAENFPDYEPYKSQTATFPLAEGQKLMEGSYLADDGTHHKRKQVVLDGTEKGWYTLANQTGTNTSYFYIPISDMKKASTLICDKFINRAVWNTDEEGIQSIIDNYIRLRINTSRASTVAELKTWLSQNPITVEYELAEEEIVPYTAEQQEAWNKIEQLHTYKNVTNIYSEAELDIVYVRDNGLTSVFATKLGMNSEIKQTKELIDLSVNKKLEDYSTTTEMNGAIKVSAENINSEVKKKVGNNEIISKINQSSEAATIDANRISLKRKRNKFNG